MRLNEIMSAFGAEVGLFDLAADENGTYQLDIDGMPVSVMEVVESDQVVVWSRLGALPSEGRASLYRQMLSAMAPGGEAEGAVFSFERETDTLYLHRVEDVRLLDLGGFKTVLERFADLLEKWRGQLADFRPETEASAASDEDGFVRI